MNDTEAKIIALALKLKGDNPAIRVRKVAGEGVDIYIVYGEGKK
jgi:hypothetical protein